MYTMQKAADMLGITYDGALKIAHKVGVGERRGRMIILTDADVRAMAGRCESYQRRKMGKGYERHRKFVKAGGK